VQIHLAVVLFGLSSVLGKFFAFSPIVIVCGRVVFASLALLVASVYLRLPLWPRPPRSLVAFAALGVLLAVHWTTFFQSVQVSSVALALITYSTFPVFVTLLEPILFRERLRAADVGLAAGALVGVIILVPSYELGDRTTQGVLWGVGSGLTFALLSLYNRRHVRRHASVTIALYQDGFAALALLPLAVAERPVIHTWDIFLFFIMGVLCTAVAHTLFIAGMHAVKASTASMIASLEPVYGTALAVIFLEEVPTVRTVIGGLVILAVACIATLHAGGEGEIPKDTSV
jgi:drug/metabolite transporter (DMT)-like permease